MKMLLRDRCGVTIMYCLHLRHVIMPAHKLLYSHYWWRPKLVISIWSMSPYSSLQIELCSSRRRNIQYRSRGTYTRASSASDCTREFESVKLDKRRSSTRTLERSHSNSTRSLRRSRSSARTHIAQPLDTWRPYVRLY
jgi:hypothetical protein